MTTEDEVNSRTEDLTTQTAISVDNVVKSYHDNGPRACDNISFDIEAGSVTGILGPNGAGKTTLVKCLLGLVTPDEGSVEICGWDVHSEPRHVYEHVGALLEGARNVYWRLTVRENLTYFAGLNGDRPSRVRARHERLLEQFGLKAQADKTVNELSRGMQQKVSVASTLARNVDVIFLDEPALGLDVETSIELRQELQRLATDEDITIILCSHDMDVIEAVCDRVLILNNGQIIVDQDVDTVIDQFQTKRFCITLEKPVSDGLKRRLATAFDATVQEATTGITVRFIADESMTVYKLIATLREHGETIRAMETEDPDLEEVFLEVTHEGEKATNELLSTRPESGDRKVQDASVAGGQYSDNS